MKSVNNLIFAVLLLTVLAAKTFAGDMSTPGYAAPPPPPTPDHVTSTSVMDTPSLDDPYAEQSGETVETSDYLLFEAFAALLSVY